AYVLVPDHSSHPREESSSSSKSTRRLIKVDFSKLKIESDEGHDHYRKDRIH
ncbi:hypothetical protein L9F63_008019, partial [Diploptera punctata]